MPLNISIQLNDPDIAKEIIYELYKLHGYGFCINHLSDANSDKWHKEREESIKRTNCAISNSRFRGYWKNELSDEPFPFDLD